MTLRSRNYYDGSPTSVRDIVVALTTVSRCQTTTRPLVNVTSMSSVLLTYLLTAFRVEVSCHPSVVLQGFGQISRLIFKDDFERCRREMMSVSPWRDVSPYSMGTDDHVMVMVIPMTTPWSSRWPCHGHPDDHVMVTQMTTPWSSDDHAMIMVTSMTTSWSSHHIRSARR